MKMLLKEQLQRWIAAGRPVHYLPFERKPVQQASHWVLPELIRQAQERAAGNPTGRRAA